MQSLSINYNSEIDGSEMSTKAFDGFREIIYKTAGITMTSAKKSLVTGRLAKRLRDLNMKTYDDYLRYLTKGEDENESQVFTDLLTTNETYFYREPPHFDFLQEVILSKHEANKVLRIWSAASSSGEEAYTLAMILAERLGINGKWEVIGTDISMRMIKAAKLGVYNEHRVRMVPNDMRHKYLLKGTGQQVGYVAVVPELKTKVFFENYNLVDSPLKKEMFDIIFCRNVLIYFNQDTKRKVMQRLCQQLKVGCHLMTGHSESLHGMLPQLKSIKPSVYLKVGV